MQNVSRIRFPNSNQGMETVNKDKKLTKQPMDEDSSMESSSSISIKSSESENIEEDDRADAKRYKLNSPVHDIISSKAYVIIEDIHRMALKNPSNRDDFYRPLYGMKTKEEALFRTAIGAPLEGSPTDSEIQNFLKVNEIFLDPYELKTWKDNNSKFTRIPGSEVDINVIQNHCCVDISKLQDFSTLGNKVDEAYKSREEFLHHVPLSELLLLEIKNAALLNIRYSETLFKRGINDVPVPLTFIKEIEKNLAEVEEHLKNNPAVSSKKMRQEWKRKVETWETYINEKALNKILDSDEKSKLRDQLIEQYPEGGAQFYKSIIGKPYTEAFEIVLRQIIYTAQYEVNYGISKLNKQNVNGPLLNPEIFSSKNPYTIKLNFEISQQPTLAEYYFKMTAIYMFVFRNRKSKNDTEIVGITVDIDNKKNSILRNDFQIAYLKYLRSKCEKKKSNSQEHKEFVPVSIHALELPLHEMNHINDKKHRLSKIIGLAERVNPILIEKGDDIKKSESEKWEFPCLQSVGVELPITIPTYKKINPFHLLENLSISSNTSHSGIVTNKHSFIDHSKVFFDAIHFCNLDFRKHIEYMERNALETSFLQGKSIYDIEHIIDSSPKKNAQKLRQYKMKSCYEPILTMSDVEFIKFIENLTSKEQKQCQLERNLYKFKKYVVDHERTFLTLGILSEEYDYNK